MHSLTIDWVMAGIHIDAAGTPSSHLASNRYRVLAPANEMRAQGHSVRMHEAQHWRFTASTAADVILVGKLLPTGPNDSFYLPTTDHVIAQLTAARQAGVPVLADFNDDHFQNSQQGAYWRALAAVASHCIVGSATMAQRVATHTTAPVTVIGDPLSAPPGEPKAYRSPAYFQQWLTRLLRVRGSSSRLKFAWYGNPNNWSPMQRWAEQLLPLGTDTPFVIWMLTKPSQDMLRWADAFKQRHAPAALVEFIDWSEEAQWDTVRDCDIVLIPSDTQNPHMQVKTANRLTDALWAGRTVVASPLPSYTPFADYAWLTDDPLQSVRQILQFPQLAIQKIHNGRQYIGPRLSAQAVTREWLNTLNTTIQQCGTTPFVRPAPGTAAPVAQKPIRLNLGCGDKILADYINVDVVPARAGKKPDVLCDLHNLSVFEDDYADEILSVHVVEHFWRWEVEDVLREWIRVLKPGGTLILECPNLTSACTEFLENPEKYASAGKDGQRTMWVFYGDPSWKDPYMIHRWGYTPESLGEILRAQGLSDVRQEAAQFKLREPRDMRVVAVKPLQWVPPKQTETRSRTAALNTAKTPTSPTEILPTFVDLFYAHHGNKTSKWTNYLEIYERFFSAFRHRPCRILEIGVQNGGSLALYQKYFPLATRIVGVDLDPRCANLGGGNIFVEIGSQADADFLQAVSEKHGPFDLVVDDGSHIFSHQRTSFETIFPRMNPEGVYLAEDLHTSYAPSFGGGLDVSESFISYCKSLCDQVNAAFFPNLQDRKAWLADHLFGVSFFDSMVVIERRPKQAPYSITQGEAGHIDTPKQQDVAYFRRKHYP